MNNVFEHKVLSKIERERKLGYSSPVIWLTGLPSSGKSTIATKLEEILFENGIQVKVLDGDNIRMGLNKDLGFNSEDRKENIRRISEVAKLFSDSGTVTITSFISPFTEDREEAKKIIGKDFIEVFVDTSLETCINRDPKGLYKKAISGEIKDFTGINSPYEKPEKPNIRINTEKLSITESVNKILTYLMAHGYVNKDLVSWSCKNHGNPEVINNGKQRAVFIGRYQPYHNGHIRLVEQKLDRNVPVLIMVRDIPPDDKNPFTTEQTINMIKKYHISKGHDVEVMAIPDIESVNYGRGVGYEVNEFTPPKDIENISATIIRTCVMKDIDTWKNLVDKSIHNDIENYLKNYEKSKSKV